MTDQNTSLPRVDVEQLDLTMARFSLRVRSAEIATVSNALGLAPPTRIGNVVRSGGRVAACLGPDEWVVIAPEQERDRIVADLAAVYPDAAHSLTDISDRELSYRISGTGAETLLSMGCPRDLRTLETGRAVRTVFDGAQAVLWREEEEVFRLDIWRSFAPHVHTLLLIGQAEIAADR